MSRIDVPESVRRVLEPGEEVISKAGNSERDFYATNTRILVFERPRGLSYLLGILTLVLVKKSSLQTFEPYSMISGITLMSDSYWQIELGVQEKEKYIWRIPKYTSGDKMLAATEFLHTVAKKANVKVSPPLIL